MGAALDFLQTPAGSALAALGAMLAFAVLAGLFDRGCVVNYMRADQAEVAGNDFADTDAAIEGAIDAADLAARLDVLLHPRLDSVERATLQDLAQRDAIAVLPQPNRAGDVPPQGRAVDTSRPAPLTFLALPVVDADALAGGWQPGDEIPLMQPRARFTGNVRAAAIGS